MQHTDIPDDIKQLFTSARSISILVPERANLDQMNAALGLHWSLKADGKSSRLVAKEQPNQRSFEHGNEFSTQLGGRNLVISFPYPEDIVEQVTTEVDKESGAFNIVIQPKPEAAAVEEQSLKFSSVGFDADVVVLMGGQFREDYQPFAEVLQSHLEKSPKKFVYIDRREQGKPSQSVNELVDPSTSSVSEMVFALIKSLGLILEAEAASALLRGIDYGSHRLQDYQLQADTFEAVAACMRAGGQRGNRDSGRRQEQGSRAFDRKQFFVKQKEVVIPPIAPVAEEKKVKLVAKAESKPEATQAIENGEAKATPAVKKPMMQGSQPAWLLPRTRK